MQIIILSFMHLFISQLCVCVCERERYKPSLSEYADSKPAVTDDPPIGTKPEPIESGGVTARISSTAKVFLPVKERLLHEDNNLFAKLTFFLHIYVGVVQI